MKRMFRIINILMVVFLMSLSPLTLNNTYAEDGEDTIDTTIEVQDVENENAEVSVMVEDGNQSETMIETTVESKSSSGFITS